MPFDPVEVKRICGNPGYAQVVMGEAMLGMPSLIRVQLEPALIET